MKKHRKDKKHSLQEIASRVLFHFGLNEHRTCTCGKFHHSVKNQDRRVTVKKSFETGKSYFAGLQTCGSVWSCPVCCTKITEGRRSEISKAVENHNGSILMVTFTVPHKKSDSLVDSYNFLMSARRILKDQRPLKNNNPKRFLDKSYKELKIEFGIIGDIASIETPWNNINGWHPHCHSLIFFNRFLETSEIAKFEYNMKNAWSDSLLCRLKFNYSDYDSLFRRGVQVDEIRNLSDYIAKFEKSKKSESEINNLVDCYKNRWGVESELTKGHCKSGRQESLTPFDFLRIIKKSKSSSDFNFFGKLFVEFSETMKGKRQIFWSKGLKKIFGIKSKTDEELAEGEQQKDEIIGVLSKEEFIFIRQNYLKDWFLHITEKLEFWRCIQILTRIRENVKKKKDYRSRKARNRVKTATEGI
jgi:hypothetical protein